MRLIDADVFKEKILDGTYIYCQENKEDIARAIDSEPTITNRPSGKWLHDDLYLDCRCSICNSYALDRGDYPEFSAYCPHCGAEMEIQDEDND